MEPTDLRKDPDYVRYYNAYARILVTLVTPFVALTIFNLFIWRAVKMKRLRMVWATNSVMVTRILP